MLGGSDAAAGSMRSAQPLDAQHQQQAQQGPYVTPSWSFAGFAYSLFSVAMVFGPVLGYLEQWRRVHVSRSSDGYSPMVSVILIVCNSLRIVYYTGEPFSSTLLWQSVVMLVAQFGLLITVLKINFAQRVMSTSGSGGGGSVSGVGSSPIPPLSHGTPSVSSYLHRWHTTMMTLSPRELLIWYIVVFAGCASIAGVIFHLYPESAPSYVGYLSLGIEATLVTPQIALNYRRRSCEGLSLVLVLTWCVGDVVKMIFFFAERQPAPFVVCGSFQLCCDAVILLQLWLYRGPLSKKGYGVTPGEVERGGEDQPMAHSGGDSTDPIVAMPIPRTSMGHGRSSSR